MEKTDRARIGRPRGARILAGFVAAIGVFVMVGMLVVVTTQLVADGGTVAAVIDEDLLGLDEVADLPAGTSLGFGPVDGGSVEASAGEGGSTVDVALEVDSLPLGLRALLAAPALVTGLLLLVAAVLFGRLLLEIADGRPFDARNVTRWHGLAAVAFVQAFLPGLFGSIATVAVLGHVDPGNSSPLGFTILNLSVAPLLLAAALAVLGEVFRYGQRLTEDVAGLV